MPKGYIEIANDCCWKCIHLRINTSADRLYHCKIDDSDIDPIGWCLDFKST